MPVTMFKKWLFMILLFWITSIIILLSIVACRPGGCAFVQYEPSIDIMIHNETDETLKIFIDGEIYIGTAMPGGEVVWDVGRT